MNKYIFFVVKGEKFKQTSDYGILSGTILKQINQQIIWQSSEIRGLCLMKWPSEMLKNMANFEAFL